MGDSFDSLVRIYTHQAALDMVPDLSGSGKDMRLESRIATAAKNLASILFGAAVVVPSDAEGKMVTMIPNRSRRESPLQTPIERGAGTAADYARQLGDGLKYVLYYHPRLSWQRQSDLGNFVDWASIKTRDVFRSIVSTGSAEVLPLPQELAIDYKRISGLAPSESAFKDGDKPLKEWWNNTTNRDSWLSILVSQNGYFTYNSVKDTYELFLRPGPHRVPNVPVIHDVGSPIRVMYDDNTQVSIPGQRFRTFVDAYRKARVPGGGTSITPEMNDYIRKTGGGMMR